ncbi:MAG: reductive dehalogenase [Dehalobacter sp.]|nr:reductive dehalogenase [Dehalobacter sp.]
MQRFNACNSISAGRGDLAKYIGAAEEAVLIENESRQKIENIENHVPGFSLRDYVLNDVFKSDTSINGDLLGPSIPSPIDRGVPIWEGSPEEAARIIRIAMRMFGAAQVGFVELNENTKKLIFSTDPDGKVIDFEDTELAYETADKRVIPNKARWVIAYTVRLSVENMKHAPSLICNLATRSGYSRARYIQNHTQAFIKGLGYQCIGQVVQNGLGISPAFSVLAGHGEMSRLNRMITPEYGPMVQTFLLITDLPVATDQPINAGILEFCRTCKKCSESCPSAALNTEDEPSWEVQGDWNNQGHRAFFENGVRCNAYWKEVGSSCSICFSVCPFSKKNSAWVHSLVKASISTTPLLNSFFRSMDDALSYGAQKGLEEWWLLDFPEYGLAPKDWKG